MSTAGYTVVHIRHYIIWYKVGCPAGNLSLLGTKMLQTTLRSNNGVITARDCDVITGSPESPVSGIFDTQPHSCLYRQQ